MLRTIPVASLLMGLALAAPALAQPNNTTNDPATNAIDPTGDGDDGFIYAPLTVRAAGTYRASTGDEARLEMASITTGTLWLAGRTFSVVGDPDKGTLVGTTNGNIVSTLGHTHAPKSTVSLTIGVGNTGNTNIVRTLTGTLDGAPVLLKRSMRPKIPAAELAQSDPGPTGDWKAFFDSLPDYKTVLKNAGIDPQGKMFWYNFGGVFYRGRLDGSARVMVIASDPGPEECLPFVRHPMVGDAGQRVQGFLAKLGLGKSYILVNAYAYAMRPSFVRANYGTAIINEDTSQVIDPVTQEPVELTLTDDQKAELHKITAWRNEFFTRVARSNHLQAIVAMGGNAKPAYDQWIASLPADDPIRKIPCFKLQHPSAVDRNPLAPRPDVALDGWKRAVAKLRTIVTPDAGQTLPSNYGDFFTENDYTRIPRWDLPATAPVTVGDNSGTRQGGGAANDAKRPEPDDRRTLVYKDPASGKKLNYVFLNGVFHPEMTTDDTGAAVAVDATGKPSAP